MTPLTSVGLTLALLAGSPEPPTFFQLLGNSGTRYLIVHADDLGMCHSENAASFRAMEAGLVTCGSVMMPCPWVLEVVEYAKTHPDVDLGIHLTLNSEWMTYRWRPVAPVDKVRGLVDPQGYMWQSVEDVLKHATAAEVETECRAQIEYALKLGLKPTHLDTHMGTILAKPEFAEIYLKLGREYGLPVMLPRYILAGDQYVTPPQAGSLLEKLAEARVPVIDALAVGVEDVNFTQRTAGYQRLIRSIRPGVTQIIVHLGFEDDELKAITGSAKARHGDFVAFTDPATRRVIEEQGIKLIGWRELMKAGARRSGGGG